MPIRNQNWYDLQATRRYPLDERSTGLDDKDVLLRDSLLVDCHVRFPSTLGDYAFVQGITVTAALVTVVVGVAETADSASGTSVAVINLPLADLAQSVHYPLRALVPGVAGWVVFGAGVEAPFTSRYSAARQSLLSPRCARPYTPLPIPTLKKTGQETSLEGLVKLTANSPVTCTLEEATVNDEVVQALVFRLAGEVSGVNALEYFLGPCGQRPESNTCRKPAVQTINGVSPDCDGNIAIVCPGPDLTYISFRDCGGGDIVSSLGLDCGDNSIRLAKDKCSPSASDGEGWYNPIDNLPPTVFESEDLPSLEPSESCLTTPWCVDFSTDSQSFQVLRGLFAYQLTYAPYGCLGVFPAFETDEEADAALVSRDVYAATNLADTNLSLVKNCASDWALGKTLETEIKITSAGVAKNGGIVLNYLAPVPALALPERYVLVRLDGNTNKLQIRRINGAANVIEAETDFVLDPGAWYRLSVTPINTGSAVAISVAVAGLTDVGASASLNTVLSWAAYGDPTGAAGLHSYRSAAYFTKFSVQS